MPEEYVIAAIPVGRAQRELVRRLAERAGLQPPHRYADSIEGICLKCDQPVWVGPESQKLLKAEPDTPVVCFICVMEAGQRGDRPKAIRHLGNREFD